MSNEKKIAFISGASSGFGKGVAIELAQLDYQVYATADNIENSDKDLQHNNIEIVKLDVRNKSDIKKVINQVISKEKKIDIAYINAGYAEYGNIEGVSEEDMRNQFEVNVFGAINLSKEIIPHMRKQKKGRLVFSEGTASHMSMAYMGYFSAAQAALSALTIALRQELMPFKISVHSIKPGFIKGTNFEKVAIEHFKRNNKIDENYYKNMHKWVTKFIFEYFKKDLGPIPTVNVMVECATSEKPKSVYKVNWGIEFRLLTKFSRDQMDKSSQSMVLKPNKKYDGTEYYK